MSESGRAAYECVRSFILALETAGLRPVEVALAPHVFDAFVDGVMGQTAGGVCNTGAVVRFRSLHSTRHGAGDRCERVVIRGVRVVRHSGGRDAQR